MHSTLINSYRNSRVSTCTYYDFCAVDQNFLVVANDQAIIRLSTEGDDIRVLYTSTGIGALDYDYR